MFSPRLLPAQSIPQAPQNPITQSASRVHLEGGRIARGKSRQGVWLCYTGGANMHLLALERGPPAGWCPFVNLDVKRIPATPTAKSSSQGLRPMCRQRAVC